MKLKSLYIVALVGLGLSACQKPVHVVSVQTETIAITSECDAIADSNYLADLEPITEALDAQLNVVLAYAPEDMDVHTPECTMLNWASDALQAKACELYPGTVDFSVVNIGGMRTSWQKGDITRRNIFELMPFDNELVVLTLQGEDIIDLCQVFAEDGGQGVSAELRMIGEEKQLADVTLHGEPIDKDRYYHVATSDYLATGTDHMTALTHATEMWKSERKIRDLYLEYAAEQKVITAHVDGRMNIN